MKAILPVLIIVFFLAIGALAMCSSPASPTAYTPVVQPTSSGIWGWFGAAVDADARQKKAAADRAALEVTREWLNLIATPTNTPEPTQTPEPTSTPTPKPAVVNVINDTVSIAWTVWPCVVAVVVLIVSTIIVLNLLGLLRKNTRTIAKSPTGDVVYDLGHGELAVTRNSLSDRITPQPSLADDLLNQANRVRQYFQTGQVPALPDRRPALSQNDDAEPQLLAAMSVKKTESEAFAAGMQNTLPEEDRLKRLLAMKAAGLLNRGKGKESDGLPEGGSKPWQVLPRPEQIPVALPGEPTGLLEAAQLEFLEANQPAREPVRAREKDT